MTDSAKDKTPSLEFDADIRGTQQKRPWNAVLWKAVGEFVAFLPSYRDTREGRKKAKQMRVIFVVLGIGLMAVGGTATEWGAFWILFGIFLACLAFVAPVEDLKKRTWRGNIKKKQKPRRVSVRQKGRVVYDGRRVEMRQDGEKVRRVRVDRGKHELEARQNGEAACLGVLPPSGKRADGIWVCATGVSEAIDWDGSIKDDEMDRPATIEAADWERLWEALQGQS